MAGAMISGLIRPSTVGPKLEQYRSGSELPSRFPSSYPPTVITDGEFAGGIGRGDGPHPVLPAATTTVKPALTAVSAARSTTLSRKETSSSPPSDMLTTWML